MWHKFPLYVAVAPGVRFDSETKALPGKLQSAPNRREFAMLAVVLVLIALTVICVTLVVSGGHARYETLEHLLDSSGRRGRDSG
ncbi:hypothetical protein BH20ACT21_BH20ACT21_13110 [soil metagenome]